MPRKGKYEFSLLIFDYNQNSIKKIDAVFWVLSGSQREGDAECICNKGLFHAFQRLALLQPVL